VALAETQAFFFDLCSNPETILKLRKDRAGTLECYFKDEADRKALSTYPLERYDTYRKHISVGLLGGISSAFPVIHAILTTKEWTQLLDEFYRRGLTQSPIARRAFYEFADFLASYQGPLLQKYPYLNELAAYENIDLRLFFSKESPRMLPSLVEVPQDALELVPLLNPDVDCRRYAWPVHKICKGFHTARQVKPMPTSLLVYRHPETLKINFIESNKTFAELVHQMKKKPKSIRQLIRSLTRKLRVPIGEQKLFSDEAVRTIVYLHQKGIVLGFNSKGVCHDKKF
jgi:uncharacterized protein